jgi:iron(II)-dependent oxidoreductase
MNEVPEGMVLIPAGEFVMGVDSEYDYSPAHRVFIDAFYMDKHEATNASYQRFCEETDHRLPFFWKMEGFRSGPAYPDHPVFGVSWRDAAAYAEWCGKRLPTEAEWEYAARGGLEGQAFPHGNTVTPADGNYRISDLGGPVAVGSYPPNGYGLFDMQGNVVEWVWDVYDPGYYKASPSRNPRGPEKGRFRVIRGGGWHSGAYCTQVFYRCALPRQWLDFAVGFRCVQDIE